MFDFYRKEMRLNLGETIDEEFIFEPCKTVPDE